MLHASRANLYARRSSARARARTFDSQLLTAVARGTLITSRYWPSRNIFALSTLNGARTRRHDYRASMEALFSSVVPKESHSAVSWPTVSFTACLSNQMGNELMSHANSIASRRTLRTAARNWSASPISHAWSHIFFYDRVFDIIYVIINRRPIDRSASLF